MLRRLPNLPNDVMKLRLYKGGSVYDPQRIHCTDKPEAVVGGSGATGLTWPTADKQERLHLEAFCRLACTSRLPPLARFS